VQGNENNDYVLHPLIREFFQGQLNQHPSHNKMKRSYTEVMVNIARNIPETPTLEQIKIFEPLIPHLEEVALHLTEWLKPKNQEIVWIFTGLGCFYEGQGLYPLALPWYQQCVTITKKRLGDEHPDVANSLNNLAWLYKSQGKYKEAEPLYLEAFSIFVRSLGQNHPNTITGYNNFRGFLQEVIEANRVEELSDNEFTHRLLKELRSP
jgi:tetratricopeptide (TPR) repeat protein